jgi:hypothetical protein
MSVIRVTVVALTLLAAACAGDVSRAEHDQKLAELALAQQELLAAREEVMLLEEAVEESSDLAADVEARILTVLGLRGMIVEPGRDRLDALAEAVAAVVHERDELLGISEATGELGAAPVDGERLRPFLEIAATAVEWTRPDVLPLPPDELAVVGPAVEEAGDEMVTLAYEQLLAASAEATPEDEPELRGLAADLAWWALETARSALRR